MKQYSMREVSSAYFTLRRSTSTCKAPESPQASHTAARVSESNGCLPPDSASFKKAKYSFRDR